MSTDYSPAPPSRPELQWADPGDTAPDDFEYAAPVRRFQHRYWVHGFWLLTTFFCMTLVGQGHYIEFLTQFGRLDYRQFLDEPLLSGLWYSGTLLAILGAHELGHYLTCRYHKVDATLPYFIPVPPLTPELAFSGTLGAFIKIREPFPNRRVLFDVGVAGPFAGLAVLVPLLLIGLAMSNLAPLPPNFKGASLGEPLLFKAALFAVWGRIPDGLSLNIHPIVFASWFGLLATALNLMPFGQLDGGHIAYAWLRHRSRWISLLTLAAAASLAFYSASWVVWTVLMLLMILVFGLSHPAPIQDDLDLDPKRRALAVLAFICFILCFMPIPIEPLGLG